MLTRIMIYFFIFRVFNSYDDLILAKIPQVAIGAFQVMPAEPQQ